MSEAMDRKALADHLFDAHGIMLTRREFRRMSLAELRALDPCERVVVGGGTETTERDA